MELGILFHHRWRTSHQCCAARQYFDFLTFNLHSPHITVAATAAGNVAILCNIQCGLDFSTDFMALNTLCNPVSINACFCSMSSTETCEHKSGRECDRVNQLSEVKWHNRPRKNILHEGNLLQVPQFCGYCKNVYPTYWVACGKK